VLDSLTPAPSSRESQASEKRKPERNLAAGASRDLFLKGERERLLTQGNDRKMPLPGGDQGGERGNKIEARGTSGKNDKGGGGKL